MPDDAPVVFARFVEERCPVGTGPGADDAPGDLPEFLPVNERADPGMRHQMTGSRAARLSHPAIVKVLDAGRDQGRYYLILEYVEGPSFAKAIGRRAFSPKESALILSAIARGLHHAHRNGVVHGDVVPSNILLK